MKEIRSLNTLRGLAALIVLVSHYSNASLILGNTLGQGSGQIGVMLFFILSGFLMAHLYGNRPCDRLVVQRFAVARIARVVPLFYIIVVLSFAARYFDITDVLYKITNFKWLASHLLFINGVDVLWTIPPEIQFYALFPCIWWSYQRQPTATITVLICILAYLLLSGPLPVPRFRLFGLPGQFWLLATLPLFISGVLLGFLYTHWHAPEALRSHWWLLSLGLLLFLYPGIYALLFGDPLIHWFTSWVSPVIAATFFALVFLVPKGNPVLENRTGDFLGKISYSLYLTHAPLLDTLKPMVVANPWLMAPVFLALAIGLAYGSYRLIEIPTRKLLRRD